MNSKQNIQDGVKDLTEDNTFLKLKQTPFEVVNTELYHLTISMPSYYNCLNKNNWTFEEYVNECHRRNLQEIEKITFL